MYGKLERVKLIYIYTVKAMRQIAEEKSYIIRIQHIIHVKKIPHTKTTMFSVVTEI